MNVKELIGDYERVSNFCEKVSVDKLIQKLKQLEPEKVKIPQFVADWIEKCKTELSLREAMSQANVSIEVNDWLVELDEDGDFLNQDIFARAWFDGYTIEKEKRYKVVMPNVSSSGGVLTRIKHDDSWIWIDTLGTIVEGRTHTRKELEEAGFGWVFSCEGIEIEEVE